jgi:glycosyltransferase involved in cell wall biosynthesis
MELKKYRILMITTGFAPYEFSEALVNSKLVLAFKENGYDVDVISRESNQTYYSDWSKLWSPLKQCVHFIPEREVNRTKWFFQLAYALCFFKYPIYGIRWGYEVYKLACEMNKRKSYDILLTRMPSMIPHLVGLKLHKRLGIRWIANWNDPTDNIRPLRRDTNPVNSMINNILVKDIFFNADQNTYPARELWHHYIQNIIHNDKITVSIIPHIGINLNSDFACTENENIFTICHAGTIWPETSTKILTQALEQLKFQDKVKFRLHVYGLFHDNFLKEIKELGLVEDVECHGSLSYFSLMQELHKYSTLLLLEAQYDKGVLMLSKISDYASIRKPMLCLSPKEGVTADIINNYGGGIVCDNRDLNSVYEGLKSMYCLFKQESRKNDNSYSQRIYEQFKPERIIAQYEKLFEDLENE